MTYLALVKGASGFIFFIYGPRYIPYSTSLWSECRNLALEALDISASLLGGKPPLTVRGWEREERGWERGIGGGGGGEKLMMMVVCLLLTMFSSPPGHSP